MSKEQVTIQTKDGLCKTWVLTPEDTGLWSGVIFYMDAFGTHPGDGADGHGTQRGQVKKPVDAAHGRRALPSAS